MNDVIKEMNLQKERSKKAAIIDAGDWIEVYKNHHEDFVGYNCLERDILITRYRKINFKNKI